MNYEIKTVYSIDDMERLCDIFSSKTILSRISNNLNKIIIMFFVVAQWVCTIMLLIMCIFDKSSRTVISFLVLIALILLGSYMFRIGKKIRSYSDLECEAAWEAYPYKGEQIFFQFLSDAFFVSSINIECKLDYAEVVRLYEDDKSFYLISSDTSAYILPKRDFEIDIDEFRNFITSVTQLQMEHS